MPQGKLSSAIIIGALVAAIGVVPMIALGQSDPLGMFRPRVDTGRVPFETLLPKDNNAGKDGAKKRDRLDTDSRTGAIPLAIDPADSVDVGPLKAGLDALAAGDVARARSVRDELLETALDRHILTWAIATSGSPAVASTEIAAAAKTLAGWPGADALRKNSELAIYHENPDPKSIIELLAGSRPETVQGVKALARAYLATDNPRAARAVLSPFWRTQKLGPSDEAAIIRDFGALIAPADHRLRMERMLYAERVRSAQRVAALAGAKELADAWAAVLRNDKAARKLLDAVPAAQRSAGWLFARAKYLRRAGKFDEAAAMMLKAPRDKAALVDPDEWWIERRVLSRELIDTGDIKTAYELAAAHSAESPVSIVDAEFHAGWFALRGLNDPKAAATHFSRILGVAEGPISLSRAYYWLGRAAEAGGPGEARSYFEKAAAFGTAFYGQLAAARLGGNGIPVDYPAPSAADRSNFAKREAVRAIGRLEQAGHSGRAEVLYRDLARQLASPGELALLAALAEKRGNHHLALRVAKIAAARGLDLGALTHPMGVIPPSADISGAGKALAYAIARQESEFNIGAGSGAGARGLLQLLPGTAQDVAKKAGLPFSKDRLTTDAAYNATLGAAFLDEQLARFDGSYVLTFAGYNAGPRRAREWMKKYGDPRGQDLNVVIDWIERIPYTETRNYVQRVMENYEVYKMRLTGRFDIVDDLVNGR